MQKLILSSVYFKKSMQIIEENLWQGIQLSKHGER